MSTIRDVLTEEMDCMQQETKHILKVTASLIFIFALIGTVFFVVASFFVGSKGGTIIVGFLIDQWQKTNLLDVGVTFGIMVALYAAGNLFSTLRIMNSNLYTACQLLENVKGELEKMNDRSEAEELISVSDSD
jgi:amino acid permease